MFYEDIFLILINQFGIFIIIYYIYSYIYGRYIFMDLSELIYIKKNIAF